jgi:hypothetical protein
MKYFLGLVNILTQRTTQPGLNPEQQKGISHTSHYHKIFCTFLGVFVVLFGFFLSGKLYVFSVVFSLKVLSSEMDPAEIRLI